MTMRCAKSGYNDKEVSAIRGRLAGSRSLDTAHLDDGQASPEQLLSAPGTPLHGALQAEMEQAFGQRLSDVRIHSDRAAAHAALAQGARAYTIGQHIFFGAREFAPQTGAGKRLLAHELAHTIQQSNVSSGAAQHSTEAEARAAADQVMAGRTPAITHGASGIQREELSEDERRKRWAKVVVGEPGTADRPKYGLFDWVEVPDSPQGTVPPASLTGPSSVFPKRPSHPAPSPKPTPKAVPRRAPKRVAPVAKTEQAQEVVIRADDPVTDQQTTASPPEPVEQAPVSPPPEQAPVSQPPGPAPADAGKLISQHTSWGSLQEDALGKSLLGRALAGDTASTDSVLDALGGNAFRSSDRDDVSMAFVSHATEDQLAALARTEAGRRLLLRLYDELTSGYMSEAEAQQAQKILTAREKTIDRGRRDDAEKRAPIIPFSSIGFTKFSSASLSAERLANGKIWVRSHMKTEHWKDAKRLPDATFAAGLGHEFDPDELVGIHMYDEGGKTVYVPAMFLLQLSNAQDTKAASMMIEAFVTGLTMGGGGGAVGGGEAAVTHATTAARALKAARTTLEVADTTAAVIGVESTLINDHRGLIIERFGPDGEEFLKNWAVVDQALGYYAMGRGGLALGQGAIALRATIKSMRAQRAQLRNLAAEEGQALDQALNQAEAELDQAEKLAAATHRDRGSSPPVPADDYDVEAWAKYREQNPNTHGDAGSAQARPEINTHIGAAEEVNSVIHPDGRVVVGYEGETVDINLGDTADEIGKRIGQLGLSPAQAEKVLQEIRASNAGAAASGRPASSGGLTSPGKRRLPSDRRRKAEVMLEFAEAGQQGVRNQPSAGLPPPRATSSGRNRPDFHERVLIGDLENGKPTGVMGTLLPEDLRTGSKAGAVDPRGLGRGELRKYKAHRGHLLGRLFGGSGTHEGNLAWMHERINLSDYKRYFENPVRTALESGQSVNFSVRPLFREGDAAPYALEVWAQTPQGILVPPRRIATPGLADVILSAP